MSRHVESKGSLPDIEWRISAASETVFVIGPIWSRELANATSPHLLTLPYVGLRPTTPQKEAGCLIDPPVSEPIAAAQNPAATEVKESVLTGVDRFQALGAEIIEVECPRFNDGIATYYVIAPSEASANLARYDGVKYGYRSNEGSNLVDMTSKSRAEGFGDEVQRRILIGTYALSAGYSDAYYKKAQKVRTLIRKDFDNAFKKVDVLLTPTCPTTAFMKGDFVNDPLSMYLSDLLTVPANLAGLPAISIPCGFDTKGLPIGMQLIGNVLEEDRILNAANIFEIDAQVIKNRPLF